MYSFLMICIVLWDCLDAYHTFQGGGETNHRTLELVHVVFRHGDRNPDKSSLYPSNPYYDERFYPEGYGQLTNEGKRTEFRTGVQLRQRFYKFLGNTWNISLIDVRSTDVDRTKMSVELMLAGLWPPTRSQSWFPYFFWQPIPYYTVPNAQDKEILPFDACATRLSRLLKEAAQKNAAYLQRYNETFEILQRKTGVTIDIQTAFYLYVGFLIQEELGYPLEEWTESIYPEPLHSAAVDYYYFLTNNTASRRLMAGYLLRKILSDTQSKINGSLTPPQRKMFIYSAHEMNIASVLLALDTLKLTELPPYGSYILFEVHKINGIYGIKLFYQDFQHYRPRALRIPGCGYFCPYDDFYSLVEEILPTTDEDCYSP